jgi:hypothetical protein
MAGGTTSTGALQNIGAGLSGQTLISNGAGALPSWTSAGGCSSCLAQVPPTTAQNTISPGGNGVTGLTVKETSGTAADILDLQSSAGANLVTVGNTGGVTIAGLSTLGVVHNDATGLLSTSLIGNADLTAGSFTNITGVGTLTGLTVSGTTTLSGTGANELAITGAPPVSATNSLVRIGGAIAGGNAVANGGTYIGLNAPSSGAGSAADFFNFESGGVSQIKVSNIGAVTEAGALTVSGGGASITGNTTITGTLGSLTGLSSSGTVTFGGLNSSGLVHTSALGVLSTAPVINGDLSVGAFGNITGVGTLGSLAVTGTSSLVGATTLTSNAAATIPLSIVGAAAQSGDYLDVTSNGGAAGNVFKIGSSGNITTTGTIGGLTGFSSSGTVTLAALGTGVVHSNSSGVLASGLIVNGDLTAGTFTNITGVGTLGSLAVSGTTTMSGSGITALAVTGTPLASATSSLVQLGGSISGGNAVANGGTYLGLNEPVSGAGSTADFLNFQVNGVSKVAIDNTGAVTQIGNLAINNGTSTAITTTGTTAALFNANATTLNIGGAATTVSIGASTGTTTVHNNLAVGTTTSTAYIFTIGPAGSTVGNHFVVNGGGFNTTCQTTGAVGGTVVINATNLTTAGCAAQVAAGQGDNDVRGGLTATTAGTPAAGIVATVYFVTPFAAGDVPVCIMSPNGIASSKGSVSGQVVSMAGYYVSSVTTSSFVVTASGALPASTAGAGFNWVCVG